jgi:hypothetical protein
MSTIQRESVINELTCRICETIRIHPNTTTDAPATVGEILSALQSASKIVFETNTGMRYPIRHIYEGEI